MVSVSTHHIATIETARNYPTLDLVERMARALDIEIYELFIEKPSPENAMERLHQSIVQDIDKVVAEAVERAFSTRQTQ